MENLIEHSFLFKIKGNYFEWHNVKLPFRIQKGDYIDYTFIEANGNLYVEEENNK